MAAPVGARIEIETPRRILLPIDLAYLALTLALTLALHVWLVASSTVTARDGLEFGRLALKLESPTNIPGSPPNSDRTKWTRDDVIKEAQHPPGYPLAVLFFYKIVQIYDHSDRAIQVLRGAQLASVFAAALLVFPTYWLGRTLFAKPFVGLVTALLFQMLPAVAHVLSDALTESLYLLVGTTSLLFAVQGFRHRQIGMFLLAGAFSGLTYLVRPEGLILMLATATTLIGTAVFRLWPSSQVMGRLVAILMGFLITSVPYMLAIGKLSNKNSVNDAIQRVMGSSPNVKSRFGDQSARGVRAPLMAAFYQNDSNKVLWATKAIVQEISKTAHYLPFGLGILGLFLVRRQIVTDPAMGVVFVLGVINMSVLATLALNSGYVSERHTVFVVLLTCLFTGHALTQLPKFWPWLALLALLGASLPSALKSPHDSRIGHLHAGRYLAEMQAQGVLRPDDTLIDPFCWAEWYSGRSNYHIPADPKPPHARWVIMETGKSPHSRLPRYPDAQKVLADQHNKAELMFWWPAMPKEDAPTKAKVLVYRQTGDGT